MEKFTDNEAMRLYVRYMAQRKSMEIQELSRKIDPENRGYKIRMIFENKRVSFTDMQLIAEGLDCDLYYEFVPRNGDRIIGSYEGKRSDFAIDENDRAKEYVVMHYIPVALQPHVRAAWREQRNRQSCTYYVVFDEDIICRNGTNKIIAETIVQLKSELKYAKLKFKEKNEPKD